MRNHNATQKHKAVIKSNCSTQHPHPNPPNKNELCPLPSQPNPILPPLIPENTRKLDRAPRASSPVTCANRICILESATGFRGVSAESRAAPSRRKPIPIAPSHAAQTDPPTFRTHTRVRIFAAEKARDEGAVPGGTMTNGPFESRQGPLTPSAEINSGRAKRSGRGWGGS